MNDDEDNGSRPIEYLSSPEHVSMGDDWYQYAVPEHFWMRRRFEVFRRLIDADQRSSWAEIGCGHGAVQRQMERELEVETDGIDLNEYALKRNTARHGRLLCYNVFDRHPSLKHAYDNVLLFDVLEHMSNDSDFLDATLHLLKPGGTLIVNVPAFMHFFSQYDVAAGHIRRYDFSAIDNLRRDHRLRIRKWTYWGAPLIPLLLLRKAYLRIRKPSDVIRHGFAVSSYVVNQFLTVGSKLERIPQHTHGTSLMAVLEKPSPGSES